MLALLLFAAPAHSQRITSVENGTTKDGIVHIDRGRRDGVKVNDIYVVRTTNPSTGVVGDIARIQVTSVEDSTSTAKILAIGTGMGIRPQM